jgi:hypothetical protein
MREIGESGLSVNVMYTFDDPNQRAVGFKLSEGMDVPAELASAFKFASQKSKLAGIKVSLGAGNAGHAGDHRARGPEPRPEPMR